MPRFLLIGLDGAEPTLVSRWIPGAQVWIMTTFVSPSSFYIPKTTSWVFTDAAFLGLEHTVVGAPALSAGALAILVGSMMLGSSWAMRRRRIAADC